MHTRMLCRLCCRVRCGDSSLVGCGLRHTSSSRCPSPHRPGPISLPFVCDARVLSPGLPRRLIWTSCVSLLCSRHRFPAWCCCPCVGTRCERQRLGDGCCSVQLSRAPSRCPAKRSTARHKQSKAGPRADWRQSCRMQCCACRSTVLMGAAMEARTTDWPASNRT